MTTLTAAGSQPFDRSKERAQSPRTVRAPQVLAGLSIALGGVVIVGWWLDLAMLSSLVPDTPPMVANTALMGILAGVALLLLSPRQRTRARTVAGLTFAAVTFAIGAATLLEYLVPIESSAFDLLIARHQTHPDLLHHPGRPSPHTAVSFMCVSCALALLDTRAWRFRLPPHELLLVAGLALPTAALLVYVFELEALIGSPRLMPYTGMAVDTALVLLMLGIGALLARPDTGLMAVVTGDTPGGLVARRMLMGLAALVMLYLLIGVGVSLGLYNAGIAATLMVFTGFFAAAAYMVTTAMRLDRADAEARAGREQRARLAALVESTDDGIHIVDPDGTILHWNPACEALYGYRADEMIGRSILEFIPDELAESHESRLAALRRGEHVERFETWRRRRDGEVVPVAVTLSSIHGDDGECLGISTIVRDIGERRAAERAVAEAHEREQRLREELERVLEAGAAISEATASVSTISLENVLLTIATEAQKVTRAEFAAVGIDPSPDAPFGLWAFRGLDDETARRIGRPPRAVGTLGIPAFANQPVRTPDVRTHPAFGGFPPHHPEMTSLLGVPIRRGGEPVGNLYLANKRDAPEFTDADERIVTLLGDRLGAAIETARLHDREALQRSWLQAIFDHMPEGVIILDEHGAVLQKNPAACRLTAGEQDPVAAAAVPCEFLASDGKPLPDDEQPGARALRGESIVGCELTMRGHDGTLRTALISATPVRTRRGPAGAVVVFKDITWLKELERLREEWASVIAHDLRQPVATIDLGAQALLHIPQSCDDATARPILERIRASARRLSRMIADLLDASRIEAQNLALELAPTDLGRLVRECVDEMSEPLAGHPVELELEPDVVLELDEDRIRQVVDNLLSNAGKYGLEGTPVQVALRQTDSTVELSVTNHGAGIAADELPRLFTRFSRTASAASSGKKGIGLGLYIAHGLVEAHGGRIRVDSTPGESTTFEVILPVSREL